MEVCIRRCQKACDCNAGSRSDRFSALESEDSIAAEILVSMGEQSYSNIAGDFAKRRHTTTSEDGSFALPFPRRTPADYEDTPPKC